MVSETSDFLLLEPGAPKKSAMNYLNIINVHQFVATVFPWGLNLLIIKPALKEASQGMVSLKQERCCQEAEGCKTSLITSTWVSPLTIINLKGS